MQPIKMTIHVALSQFLSKSWKAIISLQEGQTRWPGHKLTDFILQCTWKTKFLGTSSERPFWISSDRISHHIHIVSTSWSQLAARSVIFCLLVEVFYWPCGLKLVYWTINVAFQAIIVKVKLPAKFGLHSFKWFCPQISSDAKYFSYLVQGIDVTYWPLTEPSIKRCTCVSKRKNSGNRWTSN